MESLPTRGYSISIPLVYLILKHLTVLTVCAMRNDFDKFATKPQILAKW